MDKNLLNILQGYLNSSLVELDDGVGIINFNDDILNSVGQKIYESWQNCESVPRVTEPNSQYAECNSIKRVVREVEDSES